MASVPRQPLRRRAAAERDRVRRRAQMRVSSSAGDLAVGLGALGAARGREDRPTDGGRLGEPHRLRDRRRQHRQLVALPDVGQHGLGVVAAPVEHRRQDPEDLEVGVEDALHVGDGVEQLPHAAVAEHLARHRDDQPARGGERVQRQHAERRRAVQQHDVVVVDHRLERGAQDVLPTRARQQLRLRAGELDHARQQVHPVLARDQGLGGVDLAEQHLVDARRHLVGVDAEAEGQAGLGVQVDEQDSLAALGERRPQRAPPRSSSRPRPSGWPPR